MGDENLPGPLVRLLRQVGHDLLAVKEVMSGADDDIVLARANQEQRVLLTFDKDFGELAFLRLLPSCGVILFRLSGITPQVDNMRAADVVNSRTDWIGHFSVVTDSRIRVRPLLSSQALDSAS